VNIQVCHGTVDKYLLVSLIVCRVGLVLAFFLARPLALYDTGSISSMSDKTFSDTITTYNVYKNVIIQNVINIS